MTTFHPRHDHTDLPVLYVYRCAECDYRGETHRSNDTHDGDDAVCEQCGALVTLEWDGGVQLNAENSVSPSRR